MREELIRLHEGEIDFAQFERETASEWSALARHLLRRWPVPTTVDHDDVRQELLAAAWRLIEARTWDPKRASIEAYIVFNSVDRAKRFIHKQRNAKGRRDRSPGRYAIPFALMKEEQEAAILGQLTAGPIQERVADFQQRFAVARGCCRNDRDEKCFVAFVEAKGSIDDAVDALYNNVNLRRLCRFNCRDDARRAVWRAASRAVV